MSASGNGKFSETAENNVVLSESSKYDSTLYFRELKSSEESKSEEEIDNPVTTLKASKVPENYDVVLYATDKVDENKKSIGNESIFELKKNLIADVEGVTVTAGLSVPNYTSDIVGEVEPSYYNGTVTVTYELKDLSSRNPTTGKPNTGISGIDLSTVAVKLNDKELTINIPDEDIVYEKKEVDNGEGGTVMVDSTKVLSATVIVSFDATTNGAKQGQNILELTVKINFGIDKTKPVVTPVDLTDQVQYAVEEKAVDVRIKDNLLLGEVKVYLNDQEIEYTTDGETFSFVIGKSNSKQTVRIVAIDSAGNEEDLYVHDFLVTTNIFARWFNNTPLFIVSMVIIAAGIGVGAWRVVASRKRKYS